LQRKFLFSSSVSLQKFNTRLCKIQYCVTFIASKFTERESQVIRVTDEITFLFIKEENPKQKLYQIHQKSANDLNHTWIRIENMMIDRLGKEISKTYKKLDRKQDKLTKKLNVDFNRQRCVRRLIISVFI
jgi:hypothetical protein